ncbi:MAG: cystathionine beta-lyase [Alphaproteobacteria bacterium]|nr:cystathionine beta-lyase [Alphaproteobacteria bacterium]
MHDETRLVHTGRNPLKQQGAVNPPIVRASTVVFPSLNDYEKGGKGEAFYPVLSDAKGMDHSYGITGTSTVFAAATAVAEAEGGKYGLLTPSGLSAVTLALLSFLSAGDHVLITDAVYGPTRRFSKQTLQRLGVETTYYDPLIGEGIRDLIKPNTKVIFLESPGSLSFEVQDIPAIVAIAKEKNIITMIDNSWASPLYYKPFSHGIDVSIQALTKYVGGHSDLLAGSITTLEEKHFQTLYATYRSTGMAISPADCYLIQRGIRTLAVRLEKHFQSAQLVANWLANHPNVEQVWYPPHPSHPQHAIWKRDFLGGSGLIGFVLKEKHSHESVSQMVDPMKYFAIGASWGGYESLILDIDIQSARSVTSSRFKEIGTYLRIHVGLEHPDDLISDLKAGFARL